MRRGFEVRAEPNIILFYNIKEKILAYLTQQRREFVWHLQIIKKVPIGKCNFCLLS